MGMVLFEKSSTFNPADYGLTIGDMLQVICVGGGGGGQSGGEDTLYAQGNGGTGATSSFGAFLSAIGGTGGGNPESGQYLSGGFYSPLGSGGAGGYVPGADVSGGVGGSARYSKASIAQFLYSGGTNPSGTGGWAAATQTLSVSFSIATPGTLSPGGYLSNVSGATYYFAGFTGLCKGGGSSFHGRDGFSASGGGSGYGAGGGGGSGTWGGRGGCSGFVKTIAVKLTSIAGIPVSVGGGGAGGGWGSGATPNPGGAGSTSGGGVPAAVGDGGTGGYNGEVGGRGLGSQRGVHCAAGGGGGGCVIVMW